ncbi:MAG TPA: amino acid permease [Gemmatimonadales bacterium]|nr:amino acid permease [Gemmatimonadales bacterium]
MTYARRLGLFSATMAVMGGIIGGGIFRTPAVVAERTGTLELVLLAWALGGTVALAGAFCYAELAERRPLAGGSYIYLRDAFGPLPAFLYGWAELLVIQSGGTAAVALTFASYAGALGGLPRGAELPIAIAAIVLLAGVNYVGVHTAAITGNVATVLKLGAIALLIAVCLSLPAPSAEAGDTMAARVHMPSAPAVVLLGAALVPVLFTYGGWQQTNMIAEEIVDAPRTLPRALLLGVTGVIVVYLLANMGYARALGVRGLATSTAPAADAMRAALGLPGEKLIAAGIAVSTFGFLNLNLLVTPRLVQTMAADGMFFAPLARLHRRYRTPTPAIMVFAGWAIVLMLSGTFAQLVDYTVFGDWIFFGLTGAALFRLRRREGLTRSDGAPLVFRVPGYPVVPAFFVVAAALVLLGIIGTGPGNAAKGAVILTIGLLVYPYWRWRRLRSHP